MSGDQRSLHRSETKISCSFDEVVNVAYFESVERYLVRLCNAAQEMCVDHVEELNCESKGSGLSQQL